MSYTPTSDSSHSHHSHLYWSGSSTSSRESDMSSSTPSKRGVTGVTKHTLDNVNPHLKEDVNNKLFSGASVESFVQRVWGIDPEVIASIKAHFGKDSNPLDKDSFNTYQSLCKDSSNEKHLYKPFQQMLESLTCSVRDSFKLGESPFVYWNALGQYVMKNLFVKRKPDMLTIHKESVKPTWIITLLSIEFVKKRQGANSNEGLMGQIPEGEIVDTSTLMVASGSENLAVKSKKKVPAKGRRTRSLTSGVSQVTSRSSSPALVLDVGHSTFEEGERPASTRRFSPHVATASNENHSSTPYHSISSSTTSQKRKRSEDGLDPLAKRLRPSVITNDQLQLATYALECMDVSTRHYTTGIFIDKFKVSLWYYDRACIIRTVDFDFKETPELLALVAFAISTCDSRRAGFDPHLRANPTNISPSLDQPVSTVIGAHLKFPQVTFQIDGILYQYRGLIGRGTMVYDGTLLFDDGHSIKNQAMKVSWPVVVRPLEASTIMKLRAVIPDWKDHLPEIKFCTTLTSKELNLPRIELIKGLTNCGELEDRQLHVLAMKKYEKLWKVGSVSNFKNAFVDCLECHYHAHTTGKVLHRDLSENNLMFDQDGDVVKGILNDWDMASLLDDAGEVPISTARHRTGTIPFMAMDLLRPSPPTHLYRHDLESFFYILVWAAMNYDLGKGERCSIQKDIADWDGNLKRSGESKNSFITDIDVSTTMLAQVRPEFEELAKEWIEPLLDLFWLGRVAQRRAKKAPTQSYDNATYGGHVTFHSFMKALGRTPRHPPERQAIV